MMENKNRFTAIISGASGLVGEQLLTQLLDDQTYEKVIAVVRKPLDLKHKKLIQQVIDFGKLPAAVAGINADHGYCCLGTTIKKAGTKDNQYIIDHDYVVEFARGCHTAGVRRFAVVSSIGANPESANFYLRTKGKMERDVKLIPFDGIYILQPSMLLGERKEYRAGEKAGIALMKIMNPLMVGKFKKYKGIHALKVAKCMISQIQSSGNGVKVIQSDKID